MAIVKVQIPIVGERQEALVYEEDRRNTILQPIPEWVRRTISDTYKGYFRSTWNPDAGVYVIHDQVFDQDW